MKEKRHTSVSVALSMILFGGVFCTSERFMNVANDAKAYIIITGTILTLFVCTVKKMWLSSLLKALTEHSLYFGFSAVCLLLSAFGLLQYVGVVPSLHISFPITGTFENPAGFAAVQSLLFPFILVLSLDKDESKTMRAFAITASILCVLTMVLSGSRAGVLALCATGATVLVLHTDIISIFRSHKWLILPTITAVIAFAALLYHIKADSADGRLFIWGRCLELIRQNPLLGHGTDGFNKCYMVTQAHYFSEHPDSPFVMLADNITHPFNEYLKLTINYGLIGLLSAFFLLVCITVRLFRADNHTKVTGIAVVASVFVMSQFSYPFHYAVVWYLVALAILPVLLKDKQLPKWFESTHSRRYVSVGLLILLMVTLRMAYLDMKWAEMSKRSLAGHTERMLPYYEKMKQQMKHNPLFLYNFAAELNYMGRYEESLTITEECMKAWNDYDVQILLADNLENTNRIDSAIQAYRHALDMIPCRFEPLESIMTLYLNNGDTLNAVRVAGEVLSKPVKVESTRVEQIKHRAEMFIVSQ